MSNNYYRRVEKILYNYKMIKVNIENRELEIEHLKNESGVAGISYDGVSTSPTHEFKSVVENAVLSNSEKIDYLEHLIRKDKLLIDSIDRSLEALSEIERRIVRLRYFEGLQWDKIKDDTGLSDSTIRRYKNNAVNKLIIGLFGRK